MHLTGLHTRRTRQAIIQSHTTNKTPQRQEVNEPKRSQSLGTTEGKPLPGPGQPSVVPLAVITPRGISVLLRDPAARACRGSGLSCGVRRGRSAAGESDRSPHRSSLLEGVRSVVGLCRPLLVPVIINSGFFQVLWPHRWSVLGAAGQCRLG